MATKKKQPKEEAEPTTEGGKKKKRSKAEIRAELAAKIAALDASGRERGLKHLEKALHFLGKAEDAFGYLLPDARAALEAAKQEPAPEE